MHAESNLRLRHFLPLYVVTFSLPQLKITMLIEKHTTKTFLLLLIFRTLYKEILIKIIRENRKEADTDDISMQRYEG